MPPNTWVPSPHTLRPWMHPNPGCPPFLGAHPTPGWPPHTWVPPHSGRPRHDPPSRLAFPSCSAPARPALSPPPPPPQGTPGPVVCTRAALPSAGPAPQHRPSRTRGARRGGAGFDGRVAKPMEAAVAGRGGGLCRRLSLGPSGRCAAAPGGGCGRGGGGCAARPGPGLPGPEVGGRESRSVRPGAGATAGHVRAAGPGGAAAHCAGGRGGFVSGGGR